MSRVLENEVKAFRQDLEAGFKIANPTYQVKATMVLAVVRLLVLIELIKNSQNPVERRELLNEFRRQKESIERGIQMLKQTRRLGAISAISQSGNLS
jgi:hypothetical protein